ncbi:hypothetical protein FGB62_213g013 [Gracilaria domingensis]|nr:hypothetical protein FGB62_213g013 [Gracilaria domingensis]
MWQGGQPRSVRQDVHALGFSTQAASRARDSTLSRERSQVRPAALRVGHEVGFLFGGSGGRLHLPTRYLRRAGSRANSVPHAVSRCCASLLTAESGGGREKDMRWCHTMLKRFVRLMEELVETAVGGNVLWSGPLAATVCGGRGAHKQVAVPLVTRVATRGKKLAECGDVLPHEMRGRLDVAYIGA